MSVLDKPINIFTDYADGAALDQFYGAMKQEFAIQGALMPDTHKGYSLPIGAAVATQDYVLPSWVGYDIGCGMCAMRLDVDKTDVRTNAKAIFDQIYRDIPVGFRINAQPSENATKLELAGLSDDARKIAEKKNWLCALGSAGGGNHFIEVGSDEKHKIWVVIHSGSRGVGHGIAQHYMRLASPNGKASEGHYGFSTNSAEGQDYINDLNWCLQYALDNRKVMLLRVAKVIDRYCGGLISVDLEGIINRNHNHAVERDGLWIHRKGATHAEAGMKGVIPGNMRDGSFIVRGKGNPDSLYSSSHGAGRVLGRREAKEKLNTNDFVETMSGIVARVDAGTLDESPFAYKDIFSVMEQQKDLVEVVAQVTPIINVKG